VPSPKRQGAERFAKIRFRETLKEEIRNPPARAGGFLSTFAFTEPSNLRSRSLPHARPA
jgi:hypothetical protein